jgi:probable HAF family extracellular repeat protein
MATFRLPRPTAKSRRPAARSICLTAVLVALLVAAMPAGGAPGDLHRTMPDYDVQELGSLGGSYSVGMSVNNTGWVAGQSTVATGDLHATLWRFGSVTDIGTFGGPGTNSAVLWPVKNELGAVSGIAESDELNPLNEIWSCGFFFTESRHNCSGFVWQDGQKRALDTLGGYNSFATGTNNHLQTVGWAENTVHDPTCVAPQVLQFRAVIWGPGEDDIQQLSPLPGDSASAATAINDSGQVVGISGSCDRAFGRFSARHSVLWENGVPINLGDLGGVAWNTPMAINRKGDIVGFANRSAADGGSFHPRAFLSTKPGRVIDLGALGDDPYSQALAINEDRQVVGVSYSEGFATCRAFIWEHGVMTDLNDLAPDYSGQLCAANDINDVGQITGEVVQEGTGRSVAFLARPLAADWRTSGQRAAAETRKHAAPAISWAAIRSIMTRSGVRREDHGR